MEMFFGRIGTRFLFVTVLPQLLFCAYVGLLLAAGAPTRPPSLKAATHFLNTMTWREMVFVLLGVVAVAVALHPAQYPLIQLLEGYWAEVPLGPVLSRWALRRRVAEHTRVRRLYNAPAAASAEERHLRWWADTRMAWLPVDPNDLLPTTLGNTLRIGEIRAASRYGMDVGVVMPRLFAVMGPEVRDQLNGRRNQLDAAARMCALCLVATMVSVPLLLPQGTWLFLPLVTLGAAWLCYRAAIAAARAYCVQMATAVDLHHRDLWCALGLPVPPDLADERTRAEEICDFLSGEPIGPSQARAIRWASTPPP
ncbi:MAG TPA: hypothetical protein VFV67_09650 [Actinophytocola sp.]|uniref:hypothetical protein n=1 Tax=Actinophytocola sp. TaxID=1872138 RepID=UPI002DBFBBB3|nr:hypothetical protein [Actinophytocola sp.]HEU5470903.1 hypothetical protein [Actinophytocola sp.]